MWEKINIIQEFLIWASAWGCVSPDSALYSCLTTGDTTSSLPSEAQSMIPVSGYMFFLLVYVHFKYFMNRYVHGRTQHKHMLAIREDDYTYYH